MNESIQDTSLLNSNRLPDEAAWPLLDEINRLCRTLNLKIVVLDDDPTGTQTVFNIPVITSFDQSLITAMLQRSEPGFFILTNSRSMPEAEAISLNKEIAQRVILASHQTGCTVLFISRSDSTLRGHFPAELLALEQGSDLQYSGYIVMPYFKEGGRYTINNIHYIQQDSRLIPAAITAFATDPVFNYTTSDLTEYIAEKTNKQVTASSVITVSIEQLHKGIPAVEQQLEKSQPGNYIVVNGACLYHAAIIALAIIQQQQKGRCFLVRSAASLVQAFFGIRSLYILPAASLAQQHQSNGGLIVMGSFVQLSTQQLQHLLYNTTISPVEINVEQLLDTATGNFFTDIIAEVNRLLQKGESVIVYTSRKLVTHNDAAINFTIAGKISAALVQVVKGLNSMPKFLMAKGGITSSDIATQALHIQQAMIAGQLLPGIPVWISGKESKFPGMPYIIFPGNVGTECSLTDSYNKLVNHAAA